MNSQLAQAFQKKKLGHSNLVLNNLFIRSAAFEGMSRGGLLDDTLIAHHAAMAQGGVGLTTVSYGAVSPEGRTFKHQLYLNDESFGLLGKLADQVHESGGKVSLQLTHCGYFSKNSEFPNPVAPSKIFNKYGALSGIFFSREMDRDDMDRIRDDFVKAAASARKAGIDAVEIHLGHGYLLSQFLSPATNRRRDEYGGSLENRARYPLEVVKEVIREVGKSYPVLVKLNLHDGLRRGFHTEECMYVARELEKLDCTALVLSGGFTSRTPFYLMRGKVPLWGMIKNGSSIAEKLSMAVFGPFIVRKYAFRENFFLDQSRKVREAVSMPLVYLGGVDSAEGIREILDLGFDFIAMARPLIHDASFLQKIEEGSLLKTECNRCNQCVVQMDREGLKCVL